MVRVILSKLRFLFKETFLILGNSNCFRSPAELFSVILMSSAMSNSCQDMLLCTQPSPAWKAFGSAACGVSSIWLAMTLVIELTACTSTAQPTTRCSPSFDVLFHCWFANFLLFKIDFYFISASAFFRWQRKSSGLFAFRETTRTGFYCYAVLF